MKRYKGFTFVELMLVMAVLGVIIMLTMPLLKNIKDDADIYRAYMKKANQDVTDMVSMALIKNKAMTFTGFDRLGNMNSFLGGDSDEVTSENLRFVFNTVVKGKDCSGTGCVKKLEKFADASDAITPTSADVGIKLPGKAVIMFQYSYTPANTTADPATSATYGYVFMDLNGDKSPNNLCEDRYKFILYKDRTAMVGCDMSLDDDDDELKK